MSWVRLDDQFANHAKIMSVSSDAFRLHVTAMCWSSSQLTDGTVPVAATRQLGWFCGNLYETIAELETAGLWDVSPGGWVIHDYLEYNPSREQVTKERTEAKKRMRNKRGSSPEVPSNISRTSGEVQVPPSPSPSPSPSERDEGLARPPASSPVSSQEPADPEWGAALSKLEALGMMTGTALLEFQALWPDLNNGKRAWIDDAIIVAQSNSANSPVYAIRVLANWAKNGRGKPTAQSGTGKNRERDLDALLGIKGHHGNT